MTEDMLNKLMMVSALCLACLAGVGTIVLLILSAANYDVAMAIGTFSMAVATVGFGWAASYYGQKVTGHPLIFTNEAEREVLTRNQRRELRRKRGEVVMERALVEIEKEKDNIVHRALEAANDPDVPPHQTQWTPDPTVVTHRRDRRKEL